MNALWIVLIAIALFAAWVVFSYNRLVSRRNEVDNAWSQIDVQLKRRLDLIPNLVETVKGYAAFEKGALEAVIDARAKAMSAGPRSSACSRSTTRSCDTRPFIRHASRRSRRPPRGPDETLSGARAKP